MKGYIYEDGQLIPARDSKKHVFCGYYAACGYNGETAGNLFAVLSGMVLAPAYNHKGKRINVGSDKAGLSYSESRKEWYKD